MPPYFSGLLSSETFEIVAESGNKRFFVHSDILAAQSEPLRTTTTGVWKDANEKKIYLLEWDGDTVGRFVEFMYIGDYQVPEPISDEDDDEGEDEEEERGRRGGMDTPNTEQSLADKDEWKGMDEVNVLLAHAKVYALAQHKGVDGLRLMALERLKTALGGINRRKLKGVSTMSVDVIELLEYVSSHTQARTNPQTDIYMLSEEPMRGLVSSFAAYNFEKLMNRKEMGLFLREGGDFAVELMEKVAERFYETGNEFAEASRKSEATEEALRREVQRLETAKAEKESENLKLRKSVADLEKLLEAKRATKSALPKLGKLWAGVSERIDTEFNLMADWLLKSWERVQAMIDNVDGIREEPVFSFSGWSFPPNVLYYILAVSVMGLFTGLLVQQALQFRTIDGQSFHGICKYYEKRSWAGGDSVVVGKRPLRAVCSEGLWDKKRIQQRFQKPLLTHTGALQVCQFYEANSWAGSAGQKIEGKPLKEVCISKYLAEKSTFW